MYMVVWWQCGDMVEMVVYTQWNFGQLIGLRRRTVRVENKEINYHKKGQLTGEK